MKRKFDLKTLNHSYIFFDFHDFEFKPRLIIIITHPQPLQRLTRRQMKKLEANCVPRMKHLHTYMADHIRCISHTKGWTSYVTSESYVKECIELLKSYHKALLPGMARGSQGPENTGVSPL